MEKENVLEIEYQEVFDKIAVRIKYLNDDFFAEGLLKEDVEKYNCSFIKNPTDLEEHVICLYGDIYLSNNNIYCYCEETINKIKEFVDFVNEKYGIIRRWRAEQNKGYFYIYSNGLVDEIMESYKTMDNQRYELGNYFRTEEEAQKIINSKEWQEFWERVKAGEIGK